MPYVSTYGAAEIKQFISRNTWKGFVITMTLVSALLLLWSLSMNNFNGGIGKTIKPPIITDIGRQILIDNPIDDSKFQPIEPTSFGIAKVAGIPVPINEANIFSDLPVFANTNEMSSAMSHTGTIDINHIPNFNPEASEKQVQFNTPEIPSEDIFVFREKDPGVDIAQISQNLFYPKIAQNIGVEGKVIVSVYIDKNGKPLKTVIKQSISNMLNESAVNAVMKGIYTPALQNGNPVGCWVTIPIEFRLKSK
jgi:protein TonB